MPDADLAIALSRLRFSVRHRILDSRLLGWPYMNHRPGYSLLLPKAGDDLCVDGFPRSANSYAFYLTKLSQGPDFLVSGHTHSSRTLWRALDLGVPAVVLTRAPRGVAASMVQHTGSMVTLGDVARAYIRFHRELLTIRDHLIISDFPRTTNEGTWFLLECNRRHATSFLPYAATEANERAVFETLDRSVATHDDAANLERVAPRPSATRLPADAVWRGATRRDHRLLDAAAAIHAEFTGQ